MPRAIRSQLVERHPGEQWQLRGSDGDDAAVPETTVIALNEKLQIELDDQAFADLLAKVRELQTANQ